MAKETTLDAQNVAASLRASLKMQPESQQNLPALEIDTNTLNDLFERWQKLAENLLRTFERNLPAEPSPKMVSFLKSFVEMLPTIISVVWWSLLLIIVGIIVYALIRFLMDRNPGLQIAPEPLFTGKETTTDLTDEIKRALENSRIDLALRLRWRLFTLRMDYPKHITPAEYAQKKRQETPFSVSGLYAHMFGGKSATKEFFNSFHAGLKEKEATRGFK